jgi:ubiquinone/menaquinone biosynthesis C-methylase UbiE
VRDIERLLQEINGGRVLDVATLEGRFAKILMDNLKGYIEIIGIDIHEQAIERANDKLGQERVQFLVMNAENMDFEDESFNTVCISASLHHLSNIERVLKEMKRVLKPGGAFIIAEMHRDAESEAESTSVELHQWAAEVDSKLGRLHNHTLARQEIVDYVANLGLSNSQKFDISDSESDPMDEERVGKLEEVINMITARAEELEEYREFQKRGEVLRKRLHEVGARGEPVLVVIGEK